MSKPMFRPKRKKVETDTQWYRDQVKQVFKTHGYRVRDDEEDDFDINDAFWDVMYHAELRGRKKFADSLLDTLNSAIQNATEGSMLDFGGQIANRVDALNFCKAIVSDAARTS